MIELTSPPPSLPPSLSLPCQELLVEKGDVEQFQSRLTSQQKEMSLIERQLHDMRAEYDKTKKMKKTAEDKITELTRKT